MAQSLLEKKLEKDFVKELDKKGITSVKGNPLGLKGFPDRMVFADKIYFVELKVGKEHGSYYKLTPIQRYWKKLITKSNGNYVKVVGEKGVKEFIRKLPDFLQKKSDG